MTSDAADLLDTVFSVTLPPRPYPGLRPFEKNEWPIFFGRERMADDIVAQLLEKRVLMVHGDSGCGKSSLVRAAVLPRLEHENARGGIRWRTCECLPREAPLWNIAVALASLDDGDPIEDRVIDIRRVLNFRRDTPKELVELVCRDRNVHVCILIDQFEEIFDHARRHGPAEAQLLIDALIGLFDDPPEGLYIILTMRSEFLGACARFNGFAEMVNGAQYLLPRMGHDDLLRAIREPAALYHSEVSRELAERLITDSGGEQDQLPLIQHGLMLMFREQMASYPDPIVAPHPDDIAGAPAWRLTLQHYRNEGRLAGLLSDHADFVQQDVEKACGNVGATSRLVEDLFRALTDVNAEGHAIRRPQTLEQLLAITGAKEDALRLVVDKFRIDGVSFLNPYGTAALKGTERIDVSHEALLRCWRKLADPEDGWLMREFRNGLVWRSLLVQADSFERDPANVLSPTTTDEREEWIKRRNKDWAVRHGGGWERVQKLMLASIEERSRKQREEAAAIERAQSERFKWRNWKLLKYSFVILLLLLILLILQILEARKQADIAKREAENAVLSTSDARRLFEIADAARLRAEKLADENLQTAEKLKQVIADLKNVAATGTSSSSLVQTIGKASVDLTVQVDNLTTSTMQKSIATSTSAPRIYILISESTQRARALVLKRLLEASTLGIDKIGVPSIELVNIYPSQSELRCFRKDECANEALRITETVNRLLRVPNVKLVDISERYEQSTSIRPRHYELWLSPGEISTQKQ